MVNQLTQHFTAEEATVTTTGLHNEPTAEQWLRILNTATNMEVVRAVLGRKPIRVSSWYRSSQVNSHVGGAPSSEHLEGAAVDFTCPAYGTPYDICKSLLSVASIINYNQLILEPTWVHISFPADGVRGKLEVLTRQGSTYYKGLVK